MGREIAEPQSRKAAVTSTPEVEFALVINRMIDSIKSDPEHLRATVYELARHKLKEQFGAEPDVERLSDALEVAIRSVEAFSTNPGLGALPGPQEVPRIAGSTSQVDLKGTPRRLTVGWLGAPVRLLVILSIVLSLAAIANRQGILIDSLQEKVHHMVAGIRGQAPRDTPVELPQTTASIAVAPPTPSPLTPTAFGVYAISADKLYELEALPGRAPDPRVAISAAILTPSRTTLPDGHLKFIVFRRDSATSAADHAEVRVVAKISREMTFDQGGKPVASKPDDSWVIRNISIPYRTAPKKDAPDMYEVQSEDPEKALAPGRYALVLKSQAYDFSVAGTISDPKQCLERLAATNGQFYSECPSGQTSTAKR
jgi:hypothetical protein